MSEAPIVPEPEAAPAGGSDGTGMIVAAVGAGLGLGAMIGVGIAAFANSRWTADVEADMSQQLHQLLSRATRAAERLRRSRR